MTAGYQWITWLFIGLVYSVPAVGSGELLIDELAAFYQIDEEEAKVKYDQLFSGERVGRLAALEYFSKRKAFRIIAIALNKLDENLKPSAIKALADIQDRDTVVLAALLDELERRNFEILQGGENLAAHIRIKETLISTIAKLTGLSGKDIDPESVEAVKAFLEKARQISGLHQRRESPND